MGRESKARGKQKLSVFEILKAMVDRGMDVRMSPLSNTRRIELTRGGTLVSIGVDGDIIFRLHNGMFVGGLLLADKEQYEQVKGEMMDARGISRLVLPPGANDDGGNGGG